MWWPWHYDQRAADEADERAVRDQDEREEYDRMARLEAFAQESNDDVCMDD